MKRKRILITSLIAAGCFSAIGAAQAVDTVIIGLGSTWKYDDSGTDLGTAWRDVGFDDGAWSEGPAMLGYGNLNGTNPGVTPGTTLISFGPNAAQKNITYYFRHEFMLTQEELDEFTKYKLDIVRDDAAVVYFNGQEVFKDDTLPLNHNYLSLAANPAVSGAAENTPVRIEISSNNPLNGVPYLVAGTNVIAVEVHQQSQSSSDMGFDFGLIGNDQPVPPINFGQVFPPAGTGLDFTTLGDVDYRRLGDETDLEWSSRLPNVNRRHEVATVGYALNTPLTDFPFCDFEAHPSCDPFAPEADRQFAFYIGGTQFVETERVDVRASASVQVSIDLRSEGSGDSIQVDVYTSSDGILFTPQRLISLSGAGMNDIRSDSDYTQKVTYTTTPEQIPNSIASLYISIRGTSSSTSSAVYWDNIRITADESFTDFATYIASFGLVGADAAQSADPDSDGITNLLEYAFGGDPTNGTPTDMNGDLIMPQITFESEEDELFPVISYRQREGIITGTPPEIDFGYTVNDLRYVVEGSEDLIVWGGGEGGPTSVVREQDTTVTPIGNELVEVKTRGDFPVNSVFDKQYFRVRVEYVPPPE